MSDTETKEAEVVETTATSVPAVRPVTELTELTVDDIVDRLAKIQSAQRRAMKEGIDFGRIPGTGTTSKPTLLKAGAEKLCVLFRLDPQFETQQTFHDDGHLSVISKCVVYHQASGQRLGGASAICSSREKKYAFRGGQRLCPNCGKATIIKPKPREGREQTWWCNKYKDGCGQNFALNDPAITGQQTDAIKNPDLADTFPTVLRMAEKRALVAAVRLATGASAIFDEEVADRDEHDPVEDAHEEDTTKASAQQVEALSNLVKQAKDSEKTKQALLASIPGAAKLADLTSEQAAHFITVLQARVAKKEQVQ